MAMGMEERGIQRRDAICMNCSNSCLVLTDELEGGVWVILRFLAWVSGRVKRAPFLNEQNMKLSRTYGKYDYVGNQFLWDSP